jgi:hypothetical protein
MSKPIINSTALTLTTWGVLEIQKANYYGFFVILFGVGLEFLKYTGRRYDFW